MQFIGMSRLKRTTRVQRNSNLKGREGREIDSSSSSRTEKCEH